MTIGELIEKLEAEPFSEGLTIMLRDDYDRDFNVDVIWEDWLLGRRAILVIAEDGSGGS